MPKRNPEKVGKKAPSMLKRNPAKKINLEKLCGGKLKFY
jgi:hypothetical protein